jgi:hypothetical protein
MQSNQTKTPSFGAHASLLTDYQATLANGTLLTAGSVVERSTLLDAEESATKIVFWRIKNSWGTRTDLGGSTAVRTVVRNTPPEGPILDDRLPFWKFRNWELARAVAPLLLRRPAGYNDLVQEFMDTEVDFEGVKFPHWIDVSLPPGY